MPTNRLSLCAALAATCVAAGARPALATTVTFDDLPNPGAKGAAIANGYGGLTWDNFNYVNAAAEKNGGTGAAGYNYGDISGDDVALNGGGALASIASGTAFEFNSAYFTAAWNNGLQITLTGYLHGVQVDQTTFTVSAHTPTLITLNWSDVTSVTFSSSGGTNAGYRGFGEEFAMDNMTFTPSQISTDFIDPPTQSLPQTPHDPPPLDPTLPAPEPAGWALMIIGVGLVGGMLRRRAVVRGA
jgi:hypothetical protein